MKQIIKLIICFYISIFLQSKLFADQKNHIFNYFIVYLNNLNTRPVKSFNLNSQCADIPNELGLSQKSQSEFNFYLDSFFKFYLWTANAKFYKKSQDRLNKIILEKIQENSKRNILFEGSDRFSRSYSSFSSFEDDELSLDSSYSASRSDSITNEDEVFENQRRDSGYDESELHELISSLSLENLNNSTDLKRIMTIAHSKMSRTDNVKNYLAFRAILDRLVKADNQFYNINYKKYLDYIERSQIQLEFLNYENNCILSQLNLSDIAKKYYNIQITSDSYEHHTIIRSLNILADALEINYNPKILLHSELILKKALLHAQIQNHIEFDLDIDLFQQLTHLALHGLEHFLSENKDTNAQEIISAIYGQKMENAYDNQVIQVDYLLWYMKHVPLKDFVARKYYEYGGKKTLNMDCNQIENTVEIIANEAINMFLPGTYLKESNIERFNIELKQFIKNKIIAFIRKILLTISDDECIVSPDIVMYHMGVNPESVKRNFGGELYERVKKFLEQLPEAMNYLEKAGRSDLEKAGGCNQILCHLLSQKYIDEERFIQMEIDFNFKKGSFSKIHEAKSADEFLHSLEFFNKFIAEVKKYTLETRISKNDSKSKYTLIQQPNLRRRNEKYILIEHSGKFSTIFRIKDSKWSQFR